MQIDFGNPISGHPLNRGLIHWWHAIAGPTGPVLVDLCNPLTFGDATNGPVWSADLNNVPCFEYDGTNDFVNFGDLNDLDGLDALSVLATTYPRTTSGGTDSLRIIVTKDDGSSLVWTMRQLTGGDKVQWYVRDGTGIIGPQEFTGYVVNEWQMSLGTYQSGVGLDLYRNGFATSSTGFATVGTLTSQAYPVSIGATVAASGRAFQGLISDVRIFNRRIAADEAPVHWEESYGNKNQNLFNRFSNTKYFFSTFAVEAPYITGNEVLVDQEFIGENPYELETDLTAGAATGGDIPSVGGGGFTPLNSVDVNQLLLTTLTIPILTVNVVAVDQQIALTEAWNTETEVLVGNTVNLFLGDAPNVLVSDRYRR